MLNLHTLGHPFPLAGHICLGLTFESVFPQLVTVLQLPYDNAHVNVDAPANNIDYLPCILGSTSTSDANILI